MLAIDRHFLRHVQDEVTIVPIIAKADTMTDDEIARYRAEVIKMLKEESIHVYSLDDDSHVSSSGKKKKNRNTTGNSKIYYRGRRPGEALAIISRDGIYPWGNSCAFDPEHSDLKLIRDSLLSKHTERFLELATEKYCSYRDRQLSMQRRWDFVKYAALVGLVVIQLGKVEFAGSTFRAVFSKLVAAIPVQRISRILSRDSNMNCMEEKGGSDDKDDLSGIVGPEQTAVPDKSNNRRSIFGFFGGD